MSSEPLIRADGISKCYRLYRRNLDRLRQMLWLGQRRFYEELWALKDVSFELEQGRTLGIVGRNGSGKSTLLQLIAGIFPPTQGHLEVNGRVSALLELGAGFNFEFTGRENVFLYAAVLGMRRQQIEQHFDDIIAFAEIGDFIDAPVKTYSSGMFLRLAFSVAINVEPDILIVDEALAVGDGRFQQRCMTRIRQLRDQGVAILYVSHEMDSVKRVCDKVIVLNDGQIVNQGDPFHMTNWYLAYLTANFDLEALRAMEASAAAAFDGEPSLDGVAADRLAQAASEFRHFRHGDGTARIRETFLTLDDGRRVDHVAMGETVTLHIEAEFYESSLQHVVGFYLRDKLGTDIVGINTYQEQLTLPEIQAGDRYEYTFRLPLHIKSGTYSLSPSVAYNQVAQNWMDYIENAVVFQVVDTVPTRTVFGFYYPPDREVSFRKK